MLFVPAPGENIPELNKIVDSNTLFYWLKYYVVPILRNSGSGSSYNRLISGCGRVAGLDYPAPDSGKPTLTTPSTLALRFKAGTTYELADAGGQMREITLASNLDVLGVPPGLTNVYAYLRAVLPEDSDDYALEWHPGGFTTGLQSALTAAGYPCVGQLSSGADSVTAYAAGKANGEDIVVPSYVQDNRIDSFAPGGGGGGTVDLSAYDLKADRIAADADLQAQIAALANGPEQVQADFSQTRALVAAALVGLSEVNPSSVERYQASTISSEAGHGQWSTPDYSPDTGDARELTYDANQGVFI